MAAVVRWVQSYDSTRLVDTDSGGPANDLHVGDVDDMHVGGPSPKNPHKPERENNQDPKAPGRKTKKSRRSRTRALTKVKIDSEPKP